MTSEPYANETAVDTGTDPEQQEIDVRDNRESKAYAAETTQRVARASDGGAPPRDAPRAGEMPEETTGGTAAGNPIAGLEIDPTDAEEAVEPSQDAMEVDGPPQKHA